MGIENGSNFEQQEHEATSKVVLHFMRHSEKETNPDKTDKDIELTARGKKMAKEKSSGKNVRQSVAYGSLRSRTQQTAGFVMAGQEDQITGEENLKQLQEKLDQELNVGSKIGIDERLNFNDNYSTPYGKEFLAAFKEKKLLSFLVERSDALADQLGDQEGSTYSRLAGQVAGIVKKYVAMAPRWDQLANDQSKDYNDTLERFLGTHQSVSESFLAKVIERTKGIDERNALVELLGSQGFDFVEGFNVEIKTVGETQEVQITFHKEKDGKVFDYDQVVPMDVIEQIFQEGNINKE